MKRKIIFSSVILGLTVLILSVTLLTCSDGLFAGSGAPAATGFAVSVAVDGGGAAGSKGIAYSDGAVSSVSVVAYDASGAKIGSGSFVKRVATSDLGGAITVASYTGVSVFEAAVLNSSGVVLYVGRAPKTLVGDGNDSVSIAVGLAGLKGGSIQGQVPTLTTAVKTIAGTAGTQGSMTSTNMFGTAALFTNPYAITTDGTNLFIVDEGTHNIRKMVIATQEVSVFAGHVGISAAYTDAPGIGAGFTSPRAITTDGTYLYVSDAGNNVRRILIGGAQAVDLYVGSGSQTGGATDGLGSASTFLQIHGLTYFGGYLYVSDTGNHTIRRIDVAADTTRDVITFAGSAGLAAATEGSGTNARFNGPQGITTDGTNLYVADTLNNKIRQVPINGTATTTIAGSGVAGHSDNVTGTSATFDAPKGITTDGTYLYVTDSATTGNTVRQITISGVAHPVSTIAGSGAGTAGNVDAVGGSAQFCGPYGIVTDGNNLWVADYASPAGYCIRKIQ